MVDDTFSGPSGRLARFLDGGAVAVRLRRPPPLETELSVRHSEDGVGLFDGDRPVAEARRASISLDLPKPPTFEEAEAAATRFRGFEEHVFPSCFVCGPERGASDGLRIFPGPLEGRSEVAAPWIPDASLARPDGNVLPEFLRAALDCPGAFAFPQPHQKVILLGELQVELSGTVAAGERCVLVAWEFAHEGRKHHTATVLFGESGACRGVGVGIWIEVAPGTA